MACHLVACLQCESKGDQHLKIFEFFFLLNFYNQKLFTKDLTGICISGLTNWPLSDPNRMLNKGQVYWAGKQVKTIDKSQTLQICCMLYKCLIRLIKI